MKCCICKADLSNIGMWAHIENGRTISACCRNDTCYTEAVSRFWFTKRARRNIYAVTKPMRTEIGGK